MAFIRNRSHSIVIFVLSQFSGQVEVLPVPSQSHGSIESNVNFFFSFPALSCVMLPVAKLVSRSRPWPPPLYTLLSYHSLAVPLRGVANLIPATACFQHVNSLVPLGRAFLGTFSDFSTSCPTPLF
jgi:hypothetical protein